MVHSWSLTTIGLIVLGVLFLFSLIATILRKLHVRLPDSARTWQSFLQGQGAILAAFLLAGAALGWVSLRYFGHPPAAAIAGQIRLVEFRQLALTGQPAYEEIDADGSTSLSLFARSSAPDASSIQVTVLPDAGQPGQQPGVLLEAGSSAWSRLDEKISAPRLMLIVRSGPGSGPKATQADILVFLNKK